jgi:hypothetical protein
MPHRDSLPNLPSLPELRQELAALYGDAVDVFAGRHHARFIPEDVPQQVLSRVFQVRWTRTGDAESRKKRPTPFRKNDYYERYGLTLTPIEPWRHLSAEEFRHKIREMAEESEEKARIARQGR